MSVCCHPLSTHPPHVPLALTSRQFDRTVDHITGLDRIPALQRTVDQGIIGTDDPTL